MNPVSYESIEIESNESNQSINHYFALYRRFFAQNKAKNNKRETSATDINNTNKNQAIKEISIVLLVLL